MMYKLLSNFKILFTLFLCTFSAVVFAQTATVTGNVSDAENNPIIGANVVIDGTTTGTVTDIDGNYVLEVPAGELSLKISFIGYLDETFTTTIIEGQSQSFNANLIEDLMQLEDVVVIGYGTIKRSDLTGAVASVAAEDLTKTTNANIGSALQGRAAGVRVSSVSNAPGSTPNISIRGVTSINGSTAMWVIDGVPGDPNSVNSSDIESIEILKDAGTAAIYGSNAGNGVVIVTTKRGKTGKTSATLNVSRGWQALPKSNYIDVATGPEYGDMYTEYQYTRGGRVRREQFPVTDTLPTYNYQDEIFRQALMENYELGISGGNERSTFYAGIGYTSQDGIVQKSAYSKFSGRINSEHKLNDWLTIGENISILRTVREGFDEWEFYNLDHSPIIKAIQYSPYVPPYIDADSLSYLLPRDGYIEDSTNWSYSPTSAVQNPVNKVDITNKKSESMAVKATFFARITPVKGFSIESKLTGSNSYHKNYDFSPVYEITAANKNPQSSLSKGFGDYHDWQWQNFATYSNSLFDVHNFTIMLGMEAGKNWNESTSTKVVNLINETEQMWYFDAALGDTSTIVDPRGSGEEVSGFGYFGRLLYDYKGMVLVQANIRKDYSSKFGPERRSGVFPSASIGFKFTELDIVRNTLPFLNFGKVRYSSGTIGSNNLRNYAYYSTVSLQEVLDYNFSNSGANSLGAATNMAPNNKIGWEGVKTENMGFDLAFLQNRLSVTAEWFRRTNNGMIMSVEPSGHAGWYIRDPFQETGSSDPNVDPPQNVGKMVNKGYEAQVGWKDSWGKLNYSVNLNYTYVSTEAKDLPDTIFDGYVSKVNTPLCWTVTNGALSEFYGYESEGLFSEADGFFDEEADAWVITNQPYIEDPETGKRTYAQPGAQPGDLKFKDRNGDGEIDDSDIGPIGNPIPKHDIGLNIDLNYGWFDFNLFLQGALGHKAFNAVTRYQRTIDGIYNWSSDFIYNHYRDSVFDGQNNLLFEPNHDAKHPRLDIKDVNGNYTKVSSYYLEDASYIRIKNIQVGVTLPKEYASKAGLESLRIYFGVQNLYTFTKYTGFDPEITSDGLTRQGIDRANYPKSRMFTIGANMKF